MSNIEYTVIYQTLTQEEHLFNLISWCTGHLHLEASSNFTSNEMKPINFMSETSMYKILLLTKKKNKNTPFKKAVILLKFEGFDYSLSCTSM